MAEVDDSRLDEAYQYWHDCGFDEGYQVGYEDGYETATQEQERRSDGWSEEGCQTRQVHSADG